MADLSKLVKAYDVRGTVPDQLNEEVAEALGAAFAQLLLATEDDATAVVVAHDMRESSPWLAAAFGTGVRAHGMNVINVGLGSTDLLYFASGRLGLPGAMLTASHNPARYNGIKLCRSNARPIGQDTGLAEIRRRAEDILGGQAPVSPDTPDAPETAGGRPYGTVSERDMLADYAAYLRKLVDLSGIRPLTVVVDAGNGMAGHTVPAVLGDAVLPALPLTIIPMYFELDGSFPNHEANPLEPANLVDLSHAVRQHGADLGLAFDGDADRCFVVDGAGEPVSPSTITALVAARELAKHPGSVVIHNLITSSAVPEIVRERGGTAVRTRVGHSFIKAEMARTSAVFGGEHSAHYYFRDFWFADTGMLAAMHVLAALGEQDRPLVELVGQYQRYVASGEINSTVTDQAAKLAEVKTAYAARLVAVGNGGGARVDPAGVVEIDELDGLTVRFVDGAWINLRPSNTEPLLRLNVEAPTAERMRALRDEVLAVVRSAV